MQKYVLFLDNTFTTLRRYVARHGAFTLSEPQFSEFKNVQNGVLRIIKQMPIYWLGLYDFV